MSSLRLALAAATIGAALLVPSASAKFRLTMSFEPVQPRAGAETRVVLRSDLAFSRPHGIRLFAVGPWREPAGQASVEVRLRRIAQPTLAGAARFPYAGRWHLSIPASAASPPLDVWVRVRARR